MKLKDFGQSGFPTVTKEEWLIKASKNLKERSYEDLFWQHPELGEIEPFLTQEEAPEGFTLPPKAYGGEMNDWQIRQSFEISNDTLASDVNAYILKALEHGVGGIALEIAHNVTPEQIAQTLKGVYLEMIDLTIVLPEGDSLLDVEVLNQLKTKKVGYLKKGVIAFDPITAAFDRGDRVCQVNETTLTSHLEALKNDRFRVFRVEAAKYFEAGMSEVHEIALALHIGHTYWRSLQKQGMTADSVSPLLEFHLSAGTSYFPTITKLRSFRQMWAHIAEASGIEEDCSAVTWVHVSASQRHFAQNDKHNNLLRLTTAAMAAVMGGCDSLDLPSFEPWSRLSENHFRWSRNIQHLLKEESMLNIVTDPAGGSYYVDQLTDRMIDAAASAYAQLEERPLSTAEGTALVESWLEQDRKSIESAIAEGGKILVGVNKYRPDNPVKEGRSETKGGRLTPIRLAHIIQQKRMEQ